MARKLELELELSDSDVDYFRQVMDETWRRNANQSEKEILDEARRLLERSRNSKAEAPQYVRQRLEDVGTLISMLEDTEWPLEQEDRERTVAALSYFAEPQDIIPDNIPGLGFLDDALLSELLMSSMATVSKKCIGERDCSTEESATPGLRAILGCLVRRLRTVDKRHRIRVRLRDAGCSGGRSSGPAPSSR